MTGLELLVISLIFYWLFGSRVLAMVDVLSTRLQAFHTPWEPRAGNTLSPLMLRQMAQKKRERESLRASKKLNATKAQENSLFLTKEHTWFGFPKREVPQLKVTPCSSCDLNSREKWKSTTVPSKEQDVTNILQYEELSSPNIFVRLFSCLVRHYNLRTYRFATICDTVLTDDRVQDAIAETTSDILSEEPDSLHTDETYRKILLDQTRKAKAIVSDMHAAMSNLMLKITSYVLFKLFPLFLTSVCVHPTQIDMLRTAEKTGLPMIFVPLHRSHLDYTTLIFTLLNSEIRPPLTAAGINLNIPVFGILLRWLGAFYIKRRIEPASGTKDLIYRSALHSYMSQTLRAGHNIKFYIEGGRTRTGKPCLPKVGLLSIIVDAFMDGTIQDALLIPVSVNYDKLVDGNFICELLGQSKEKETFPKAMSAIWTALNSNYGSARIDFNQPYSLRELISSYNLNRKSAETSRPQSALADEDGPRAVEGIQSSASLSSLHGTDCVREDHRQLVEDIALHLVHDCGAACAVMSTNILSFILLNKCRSGVKLGVLVEMFEKLRKELAFSNRDVGFAGESVDVVKSAINLLGVGLVTIEKGESQSEWDQIVKPVTMLPNVIELSYYGNSLLPHYSMHGIIATAAFALLKGLGMSQSLKDVRFKKDDLIQHSLDLCEVLQFEFIFTKPCQSLYNIVCDMIVTFEAQGILPSCQTAQATKKFADYDDSDDEVCVPAPQLKVSTASDDLDQLRFYNMTLRPIIESYVATVTSLHRIVNKEMTESEFTKVVLSDIQEHIETGYCLYGESCSADNIKNACKVLKKWGVIETYTKDSIKLIYLTEHFNNTQSVKTLSEQIEIYKWANTM